MLNSGMDEWDPIRSIPIAPKQSDESPSTYREIPLKAARGSVLILRVDTGEQINYMWAPSGGRKGKAADGAPRYGVARCG